MPILIYLHDPSERAALSAKLHTWMELFCVSMDVADVQEAVPVPRPSILFWDLDGPLPPPSVCPGPDCALFLCSHDLQKAINSYCVHPTGFLSKPISMEALWNAMLRCAPLWFDALLRLEILSERVHVQIPLKNIVWAEGTRRGCLVHTARQAIATREPLYQLEQRLPAPVFIRCQRSFLVNLTHVRELGGGSLFLTDGMEISLGRKLKADVLAAYRQFCRLRYSGPPSAGDSGG